ncbi:MAG TPA: carbamoyltransferase [Saprospiraceae bacterium]|nr:carbamoyltransferase [Saprospiraceae bacterium]
MGKIILGISAYYHDSAAAIIVDGQIMAAAQEERFTRDKHTSVFPVQSIRYCLEAVNCQLSELDAIAFYDKPLLKFERLLQTYYAFAPRGLLSFLKAMPVWMDEKLFLRNRIYKELKLLGAFDQKQVKLLFPEHHLSHAASAFYPSTFERAAILTLDGVGEWSTASIALGEGAQIKLIKQMNFPHSLGLLYSAFTYFLGFRVNSGEYKVMGLAPYGNVGSEQVQRYVALIKRHLVDIKADGSIWLDQSYFNYSTGLRMVRVRKWERLLGFPKRKPESEIRQEHKDLALAIQQLTEEIVLRMAATAKKETGASRLCLAGGVALNGVANGKLLHSGLFDDVFVQAAAGDAGGALGAALAVNYLYFNEVRGPASSDDLMQGAYLGPAFSERDFPKKQMLATAVAGYYEDFTELVDFIAEQIAKGKIIGWFQGRMEYGPRALGNRSILADPRRKDMQEQLNRKVKRREGFRPFAPAVLEEQASEYFVLDRSSPYMSFVVPLQEKYRGDFPAITHVDYSARVQTVSDRTNPRFSALLKAFAKKTACPMLVNTSFNLRGEPIVASPADAYRCFMETEIDFLVIGDYVYDKKEQQREKT